MNATTLKKARWFWPWQNEREEAWLGEMSREGWHLTSVRPLCSYTFHQGEPCDYTYRLDFMLTDKRTAADYRQIFEDAGWECVGELSNWRYWRKLVGDGETPEIFTDSESRLNKLQRILAVMAFFLVFLPFMGMNMIRSWTWAWEDGLTVISVIYLVGLLLYAVIIPIYIVVVVQLLRRIRQLKKKVL
ncbi:MAG: DUF2812 domain-containing protein [Anaerolineae bacterium]|jgi:hypothetical protein|nr:DUF2812 domain-containing protein [Anaerolineae bacterium]